MQTTPPQYADPTLFASVVSAPFLNHYIEPLSVETDWRWPGWSGCSPRWTRRCRCRAENDLVVLRQWRNVLLETPGAREQRTIQGWGWVTAAMIDRAKLYSPDISAMQIRRCAGPDRNRGRPQAARPVQPLCPARNRHRAPRQAATATWRHRRDVLDGEGALACASRWSCRTRRPPPAGLRGSAATAASPPYDGVTAMTMPIEGIADRLRGPVGSNVRLTLQRDGRSYPVTVTLRRSHIVLKTVSMTHDDRIAVLRVTSFNARTADYLDEQIAEAHREMGSALKGLVLDLRGNPGGLVDQSVLVASMFLEGGRVVSTKGRVPGKQSDFRRESRDHAAGDAAAGGAGQWRLRFGLRDRRRCLARRPPRRHRRHLVLRQGHGAGRHPSTQSGRTDRDLGQTNPARRLYPPSSRRRPGGVHRQSRRRQDGGTGSRPTARRARRSRLGCAARPMPGVAHRPYRRSRSG